MFSTIEVNTGSTLSSIPFILLSFRWYLCKISTKTSFYTIDLNKIKFPIMFWVLMLANYHPHDIRHTIVGRFPVAQLRLAKVEKRGCIYLSRHSYSAKCGRSELLPIFQIILYYFHICITCKLQNIMFLLYANDVYYFRTLMSLCGTSSMSLVYFVWKDIKAWSHRLASSLHTTSS